jgi:hypothetical protein
MDKDIQTYDEKLLRAVDNFNSSVTTDDISASTLADNSATSIVKLEEIDERGAR